MLTIPTDLGVSPPSLADEASTDELAVRNDPVADAFAIVGIVTGSLRLAERRLERVLPLLPTPSGDDGPSPPLPSPPPPNPEVGFGATPAPGRDPAEALHLRVETVRPHLRRLIDELSEALTWLSA